MQGEQSSPMCNFLESDRFHLTVFYSPWIDPKKAMINSQFSQL